MRILDWMAAARAGLIVCGVVMSMPATTPAAAEPEQRRSITVSASGTVTAVPDIARVRLGVASEGETAREALSKNSEALVKIVAAIKGLGIDAKDIQTAALTVEPRYTNPREGETPVINGYRVSNNLELTVREPSRLGEILDQMVGLGANQVHGLSFEVSEAEAVLDAARKEAMANARRRAELFAAAGGVELGEILNIVEDAASGPPFEARMTTFQKSTPIEAGSETLTARVTVTWALK